MDVSASFQFVVDAMQAGRYIIAPDWRGYGQTSGPKTDNYWMPDYLADLDFLLDILEAQSTTRGLSKPSQSFQIDLLGHSMGGNLAMLYAGIRPERVRRLINLEGFGLPRTQPEQAGQRYAKWMDQLKQLHRGELDLKAYPDAARVAQRLMKTNQRISSDKALWLAQHWAKEVPIDASSPADEQPRATQWEIQGDPAHKIINANLYQADEVIGIYKQITAPVLAVEAAHNELDKWHGGSYTLAEYHARLQHVAKCEIAAIADAGHMMHHDQPAVLAAMIEAFLARPHQARAT
jgi:pimeloyl-ACP methyl ester carboxylesterase